MKISRRQAPSTPPPPVDRPRPHPPIRRQAMSTPLTPVDSSVQTLTYEFSIKCIYVIVYALYVYDVT